MKQILGVLGIFLVLAGIVGLLMEHHYARHRAGHGAFSRKEPHADLPAYRGIVIAPWDQSRHADPTRDQALMSQVAAVGVNWIEVPIDLNATGIDVAALSDLAHLAHEHALNICLEFCLPHAERQNLPTEEAEQDQWLQQVWGPRLLTAVQAVGPLGINMICVGDRLKGIEERADAWNTLLGAVRKNYKGSLTYAADSESYAYVTWWSSLDYIGVVGNFPLSDEPDPTFEAVKSAWDAQLSTLETISAHYSKLVLLLDVGYSANPQVAHDPTLAEHPGSTRLDIQDICYQSALEATCGKSWLAGIFVKSSPVVHEPESNHLFLPQPLHELLVQQWK